MDAAGASTTKRWYPCAIVSAKAAKTREEVVELLSSRDLQRDLFDFARRRAGSWDLGKDVASQAVRYVLSTNASQWDADRHPTLLLYLGSLVNRFLWAHRVKASTVREVLRPTDELARQAGDFPNPEEMLLEQEDIEAERVRIERQLRALRSTLADGESTSAKTALGVLDLELSGTHKPAEQAAALGVPVTAIYRARERITDCIDKVLDADRLEQGAAQ